jgi:molybdopterin converting factor small subunit
MTEISICVRYFNILADYAGTKQAEIRIVDGVAIQDLIDYLLKNNPAVFRQLLQPNGAGYGYLRIFRNGELVSSEQFGELLHDGDELILSLAITGG